MLFLLVLLSCSVPDDASGQVRAWLESLDPDADVVEVRCTGNLEEPPGSGTWKEYERVDRWTAREVLGAFKTDGVDWAEIVARCISNREYYFPKWLLGEMSDKMSAADRILFKMSFHVDDVLKAVEAWHEAYGTLLVQAHAEYDDDKDETHALLRDRLLSPYEDVAEEERRADQRARAASARKKADAEPEPIG
ncbi:hypothetical protein [Sorangium sp. So ce117]|uniref:hypothetical protein n=1 Tax=Sorangium sp. So ce117 TaxID=3133277 RepID=UPI003F61E8E6